MSSQEEKFPKLFNEQMFNKWFSIFDAWFDDPIGNFFGSPIRVDVYENDKDIFVEADIPGVKKEQIQLEWFPDGLRIAVENNTEIEKEDQKAKYYRKERRFERKERFVPMPLIVSPKNIRAKYENGILTITIPKYNLRHNHRKIIDID